MNKSALTIAVSCLVTLSACSSDKPSSYVAPKPTPTPAPSTSDAGSAKGLADAKQNVILVADNKIQAADSALNNVKNAKSLFNRNYSVVAAYVDTLGDILKRTDIEQDDKQKARVALAKAEDAKKSLETLKVSAEDLEKSASAVKAAATTAKDAVSKATTITALAPIQDSLNKLEKYDTKEAAFNAQTAATQQATDTSTISTIAEIIAKITGKPAPAPVQPAPAESNALSADTIKKEFNNAFNTTKNQTGNSLLGGLMSVNQDGKIIVKKLYNHDTKIGPQDIGKLDEIQLEDGGVFLLKTTENGFNDIVTVRTKQKVGVVCCTTDDSAGLDKVGFANLRFGYYTDDRDTTAGAAGTTHLFVQGLNNNGVRTSVTPETGVYTYERGHALYGINGQYSPAEKTTLKADFGKKELTINITPPATLGHSAINTVAIINPETATFEGNNNAGVSTKGMFYGPGGNVGGGYSKTGNDVGGFFYRHEGKEAGYHGVFGASTR